MNLYLDADIFLALIKENDWHKSSAEKFLNSNKNHSFITSSLTCLEVWFYLYKNNFQDKALDAIRSIALMVKIVDYGIREIEAALLLCEHCKLSPADAIHAVIAQTVDGIISSDSSFDKVPNLKRIDFSKK